MVVFQVLRSIPRGEGGPKTRWLVSVAGQFDTIRHLDFLFAFTHTASSSYTTMMSFDTDAMTMAIQDRHGYLHVLNVLEACLRDCLDPILVHDTHTTMYTVSLS